MSTYIWKNGAQSGPFEDPEIQQLLREGSLSYADLAWQDGLSDWQPLGKLFQPQPRVGQTPIQRVSAAAPKSRASQAPVPQVTSTQQPRAHRVATPRAYIPRQQANAAPKNNVSLALIVVGIAAIGVVAWIFLIKSGGISGILPANDTTVVKNGVMEMDKSTTLGKVFDSYRFFTTTTWTSSKDAAGRRMVEAVGTLNFANLNERDIAIALGRANNIPSEEAATDQIALAQARKMLAGIQKRFKTAQLVFQFIVNLDDTFELKGAKVNAVASNNKTGSMHLDGEQPQQNLKDIYDGHFPVFFIVFLLMAGD